MAQPQLEQLAAKLKRPAHSLAPFDQLTPEQLVTLAELVDAARTYQRTLVEGAFRDALPWPLRWLAKRALRTGT